MKSLVATLALAAGTLGSAAASAQNLNCPTSWANLQQKLRAAVTQYHMNHMWAAVVNRDGVVCAVAFSGLTLNSQWLLSRQIAAAKAFTANGLSNGSSQIPSQTFTTADLYGAVQPGPGGSLFGLAAGNPVDPAKAYKGPQSNWGTAVDPMVGQVVGGTITFGGGTVIPRTGSPGGIGGAVGVSGDTAANDQLVSDQVASTL